MISYDIQKLPNQYQVQQAEIRPYSHERQIKLGDPYEAQDFGGVITMSGTSPVESSATLANSSMHFTPLSRPEPFFWIDVTLGANRMELIFHPKKTKLLTILNDLTILKSII